jgi:hypothetical protein
MVIAYLTVALVTDFDPKHGHVLLQGLFFPEKPVKKRV